MREVIEDDREELYPSVEVTHETTPNHESAPQASPVMEGVDRGERRYLGTMLLIGGGLIVASIPIAAALFAGWGLFLTGVMLCALYLIFVAGPVILAEAGDVADMAEHGDPDKRERGRPA